MEFNREAGNVELTYSPQDRLEEQKQITVT